MSEGVRLPEVQWQFRRYFSFGLTALAASGLGLIIWKVDDAQVLRTLGLTLAALIALQAVLYMLGPTAVDLARLAAAVKGARSSSETSS